MKSAQYSTMSQIDGVLKVRLFRPFSARHFLAARHRAHERLRGRGVSILDVTPADLPVGLINRYLDIKRSGAL